MSQKHEYFGKYILLEKMAAGGMAEVFLARAPGAGGIAKFVAIKRILPQYSDNKEFVDMFKDEAKIAVNLSHSNIVSIYEFGVEQGQFFLVMDFVKGRNIRQLLNKMKQTEMQFSVDQIVYMCKEIAGGLDHAHRCLDGTTGKPLNITHRDMSPQNVMVSFEGEIKIIDFGIAKAETQLETTRAGTLKGKFGYMSPEQAEGHQVDLRTDIFSLGTVLWELLANDRLFIANNEINTLRKIRDCNIPSLMKINPDVHPELERITLKALTKDRNLRYQTSAAFNRDLSRFLNRHYPDFSPHDFAMFIKSLYADEILELNNRVVEFSKIPFKEAQPIQPPPSIPTPAVDQTLYVNEKLQSDGQVNHATQTTTEPDQQRVENPNFVSNNQMLGNVQNAIKLQNKRNNKKHNHFQQSKSIFNNPIPLENTDESEYANSEKGNLDSSRANVTQSSIGSSIDHPIPARGNVNYGKRRSTNQNTNTNVFKSNNSSSQSKTAIVVMVYFSAAVFSYLVLTALIPNQMEPINKIISKVFETVGVCNDYENNGLVSTFKSLSMDQAICPPQEVIGSETQQPNSEISSKAESRPTISGVPKKVVEPAKPQKVGIMVNSNPSGAEIFIDGVATRRTTPVYILLEESESVLFELRKKNYNDYKIENFLPKNLSVNEVKVEMEKIQVAYIDIDVQPPGYATVFVNKKKLSTNVLPIYRYQVPANEPVVVVAENPKTKFRTSKSVTLKEGQRQSVVLYLKRSPASSNRFKK